MSSWADVPWLLELSGPALDFSASAPNGVDIRVVDEFGIRLDHEIEQWDPDAISTVWVRLAGLGAEGTSVFVYFESPQVPPDVASPEDVWSAAHLAVWHLAGSPMGAGSVADSTAPAENGTPASFGTGNVAVGRIGGALAFDGQNDVVDIDGSAEGPLDVTGPLTLSAWVRPEEAVGGTIVARRDGFDAQWQLELELLGGTLPRLAFVRGTSSGPSALCLWASQGGLSLNEWHHVAVVVSAAGDPVLFFVDGESVSFLPNQTCDDPPLSFGFDVSIGARWNSSPSIGFPLQGVIDEVRLEGVARSAEEMRLQFDAMTGVRTSFGSVELRP
jgi:hypothetical protein